MRKFMGLTKRNLLVFFKDKQSIVFSLLTSIIVFVLYLLFLKGNFISAIESMLDSVEGLRALVATEDIETYSNMTLLVGILGTAMITVPFNCLTTIVRDRENKIDYDISATPIRRWQIILSYFVASSVSAIILTGIILTVGLIILIKMGNIYMDAIDVIAAYGVVAYGSISATSLFMIVVLFFKSSSASGAFFGLLSAAAGFVIGAYIPISQFSESVQTFCNTFPASHITILLRNVLQNGVLDAMNTSIGGLDQGMFAEALRDTFSFKAHLFGYNLDINSMIIYVFCALLVCIGAMIITYSKTYKRN